MVIGAKPWLADTQHPLYEAGKAAVKKGTRQLFLLLFIHIKCLKPAPTGPLLLKAKSLLADNIRKRCILGKTSLALPLNF